MCVQLFNNQRWYFTTIVVCFPIAIMIIIHQWKILLNIYKRGCPTFDYLKDSSHSHFAYHFNIHNKSERVCVFWDCECLLSWVLEVFGLLFSQHFLSQSVFFASVGYNLFSLVAFMPMSLFGSIVFRFFGVWFYHLQPPIHPSWCMVFRFASVCFLYIQKLLTRFFFSYWLILLTHQKEKSSFKSF